ncbi:MULTISPECIES: hypothetical protein [unclassified Moraxella]|uniref:hypothetical protein n=1 Tax=unclassified Moraxella TaxID=2685852 RepID=UPI003AF5F82E
MTNNFMGIGLVSLVLATTGCSTFKHKVGDNSLDYTKTQKLAPVQLPADSQTYPFVPMYQVPESGENTLKLTGEQGKRFVLPKPISTVK